jgi:hypothetical protein
MPYSPVRPRFYLAPMILCSIGYYNRAIDFAVDIAYKLYLAIVKLDKL